MIAPSQSLTSSVIVSRAVGLMPDGIKAKKEGDCAHCGLHIRVGDLHVPFSVGPGFMDEHYLAAKGSDMTCGYCAVLMNKDALYSTAFGVFTETSVLPFRKWFDIDFELRHPPCTPFVMLYSTAKNQHMAWRAPVNFSQDLFSVRVGLRDVRINRPKLLRAFETARRMGKQIGREVTADSKSFESPFRSLSPDLKNEGVDCSAMYKDTYDKCSSGDIVELENLSLGEIWAMNFLKSPGLNHKDRLDKHKVHHARELAKTI